MTRKQIFIYIFLFLFSITIIILSGLKGLIQFIIALFIYSIIFYIIYLLWKVIRKKKANGYVSYLPLFLEKVGGSLLILVFLLGGFAYYQNDLNPSKMPVYYLSNGEKEVIFHGMSHIGTQDFYDNISKSIINNKNEGYVLFYEGVKPGSKENLDKFDKAIGIKFKDNLYESFSKLYGLVNQKNENFLLLVNNLDFNIDLSIDEIIDYYEENPGKIDDNRIKKKEPVDIGSEVTSLLSGLNEKELKILVYINQSMINFIIKNDSFREFVTNNFSDKDLFDVILDKRNEVIANAIDKSKYNKIIITYGLMHFDGVLELLKNQDSSWNVNNVEYLYPIKNK